MSLSTRTKEQLEESVGRRASDEIADAIDDSTLELSELETRAPMTFYVDASIGDDSNSGTTSDLPFLTIQRAVDSIPKRIKHSVIVNVAAGNYAGFTLANFNFDIDDLDPTYLLITGTLIPATLASGVVSGTVTSATAGSTAITSWSTVTVTGAGWTTSDLRTKYLYIKSGTGAGQAKVIYDNTATVITVTGTWTTTPDATSVFEISEPGTVINTAVQQPAELGLGGVPTTAPGGTSSVAIVGGSHGGTSTTVTNRSRFGIRWFHMAVATVNSIGGDKFGLYGCKFTTTTGVNCRPLGAEVVINECAAINSSFSSSVGGAMLVSNCVGTGSASITALARGNVNVQTCAFIGATFAALFTGTDLDVLLSNCIFTGTGSAIGVRKNSATAQMLGRVAISGCSFSSFVTAIEAVGNVLFTLTNVSGSGNTTALNISRGASVMLDSASTITGTGEIVLDGAAAVTIASMRAASPRVLNNVTYFSKIYEP